MLIDGRVYFEVYIFDVTNFSIVFVIVVTRFCHMSSTGAKLSPVKVFEKSERVVFMFSVSVFFHK